jgi:hypothetical protein
MALCTIDVRENELEYLPLAVIGPALIELKTNSNPWRPQVLQDLSIPTTSIELPSLLELACTTLIQNEALRPTISSTTLSIQLKILQNTNRCQQCEKPIASKGIDCMLWRATTDTAEVPFMANVCCKTCMNALDATKI